MKVRERDYREKLVPMCYLRVNTTGFVKETKQSYHDEDTIVLVKPELTVKVSSDWKHKIHLTRGYKLPTITAM